MNSLSEKIYLELDMPSDEDTLGDKDRIIKALEEKYTNVVGKEKKITIRKAAIYG